MLIYFNSNCILYILSYQLYKLFLNNSVMIKNSNLSWRAHIFKYTFTKHNIIFKQLKILIL